MPWTIKNKPGRGKNPSDPVSKVPLPPPKTPSSPTYATINSVWDVVGADNVNELLANPYVAQDKMSMLLYAMFLRNDRNNIARLLRKKTNLITQPKKSPDSITVGAASDSSQDYELVNPFKQNSGEDVYDIASAFNSANNLTGTVSPFQLAGNSGDFFSAHNVNAAMSRIYERGKSYITSSDCLYSNFADGVFFNDDYVSEKDRFDALEMKPTAFSSYRLPRTYRIIPLNPQSFYTNMSGLFYMALTLDDYIRCLGQLKGFPNRSVLGKYCQFPILNLPDFRMQFLFRGKKPEESMLVAKNIFFSSGPDGELYPDKQYLPVIFLRDNKFNEVYSVFAGLPGKGGKKLPLYNTFGIERIEKAETVVVCGSIEDADAMQRHDERNPKCAYTAIVCDLLQWGLKDWSQVDFSPLKGKRVELLISNHSGLKIEGERRRIHSLYLYLKGLQRPRIKEFHFRERTVLYPPDRLCSITDYYNAYWKQRSKVVSMTPYSETEFLNLLASPNGEVPSTPKPEKNDEDASRKDSASKIEEASAKNETSPIEKTLQKHSGRPKHQNLTAEKTLLRPFIRRGCTTVLTGNPEIEKRQFAISLAAQVAGSKSEFLKDRFWTRCLSSDGDKGGYKVLYWIFNDINPDDILLQRNFFAKGLNNDQAGNLFIEPAAQLIRKRDCNSLKEELGKYTSKGTSKHPVDFLIIDSLVSFAKNPNPTKIFSAFEELVRLKDELPGLAILVVHHNTKDCKPDGILFDMPHVIIEMKRDSSSVLDDLEVPLTINVVKHSSEQSGIDIVPFEIKLDGEHFVVTNDSNLPPKMIQKLIIREYKHYRLDPYSNTDIGRLLGVSRKTIEGIWTDGSEEETQEFLNDFKYKLKNKTKALNDSSSAKKKT